MKKLQSTGPSLPSVFSSLFVEGVQSVQIRAPAGERSKVVELDEKRNALCCSATAAEAEPCPEKTRLLGYRVEVRLPSSVDSFPAKKRRPLLYMTMNEIQSREGTRGVEKDAHVEARL